MGFGWASERCQYGESIMRFCRQSHGLVTHANVEGKIRPPVPIVLKVGSEKRFVHINWPSGRRIIQRHGRGLVLQKISQRPEGKTSVCAGPGELRILHMFPGK